ncbi:DNA replication and repair protein RadC [Seinonella peptonophila]|uniref:DNA replication and repair protein RadC n=1 Tax=Seinonella peptonophila TaxID=112248 RepID=A0A1M4TTV4_9BACL|nr:DNA repair protein RadC [Seinonella peptonophila]SHE47835.1 DNA replication and repair protein RadC [Seinonella peptonophila]
MLLKSLPLEDRPRERMIENGPKSLSNGELIALLLRTGSAGESVMELAQKILVEVGGIQSLAQISFHELLAIHGVGPAKAVQLLAGLELGKRVRQVTSTDGQFIHQPIDAVDMIRNELRFYQQEHFICMFLNTKNRVIDKKCIFIGSLNLSVVHPREIFREAVKCSAARIICIHNHPSGDPSPSTEDIEITFRLVESGKMIGIEVVDHIVIGDLNYFSMKENGLIPDERFIHQ